VLQLSGTKLDTADTLIVTTAFAFDSEQELRVLGFGFWVLRLANKIA